MTTSLRMEIPVLAHRDLTSQQFLDGCRRITVSVLEGTEKIPLSETLVRELAGDCAVVNEELVCRLVLDRKGEFTRDKLQAHAIRINYLKALRRELKTLLLNPDPAVLASKRTTAKEFLAIVEKHVTGTERRSQAEVSTMVQFDLMAHLARKRREPNALLLAQGCKIAAELNQVAKTRETLEKKAEEKRKKKEQAEGTGSARAAVEPAKGTKRKAAVVDGVKPVDGDSALAG